MRRDASERHSSPLTRSRAPICNDTKTGGCCVRLVALAGSGSPAPLLLSRCGTPPRDPATLALDTIRSERAKRDARSSLGYGNWASRGGRPGPPARAAECAVLPAGLDGHGDQLREGLWGERVQEALRSGGGDSARGRPPPGVRTPLSAGCPGTRARSRSAPRTAARWTASLSSWCPPPGLCAGRTRLPG